jgi:RHS repeat-associated protein
MPEDGNMQGERFKESRHSCRDAIATATKVSPLLILVTLLLAPCILAGDKSGVGLNKISLPSGPGSIEGLGDSFEPQLNSGTSSYSVKIAAPPGVAGLQPDVVLRYNSGGGNGPFGIAWSAGFLCIQRQTEKGLPTYGSTDKFTLGGEELVPLSDGSYRTENESGFQRIIRQGNGWVVYDRNGTRRFLGSKLMADNPSRLVRPGGAETFDDTFKWCVDEVIDVHGNRMEYQYSTFADSPGDNYCVEIRYSIFGQNYHAIGFDYDPRPDAFSSYLSGFQVLTGRRCYQIRVTSSGALVRRYGLSYTLPADDPIEPVSTNDATQLFSMLRQVTQFDKGAGDGNFLPPLRLGYTRFDAANIATGSFLNPASVSLGNPNIAIADINCDSLPDFFHTDPATGDHSVVYNHGFGRFSAETDYTEFPTGITLDQAGADLADYDGDGRIDLVQKAGLSNNQFVFFPNTTRPANNNDASPTWGSEQTFQTPYPPFDLDDPSVRTLDLNGDKRIDFMKTTAGGFIYYYNRGNVWEEDGLYLFGEPQMGDITYADAIDFTDGAHVKLADMNGDRLLDLVRVNLFQNHLEVTFWVNKGRGQWGARQEMTGTIDLGTVPIEDAFIRDVNGDGLADVLSVAYDHVSYWINLGNNSFSRRFEVANTPDYIKGTTELQQADINGNGSTDLLWENYDQSAGAYRVSWVDFTGNVKPNLLAVIDNGIGLRTELSYRTSTDYYAAALRGSNPWHTRLPFPSWCVAKISKRFGLDLDSIAGEDRYVTEFSYFDGYYDTFEKEFRGFAFAKKVERGDDRLTDGGPAGEINSPSTVTRFAFHTGLPDGVDNNGDGIIDEFDPLGGYEEESLKGKVLWTETNLISPSFDGVDNDGDGLIDESDEGAFDGQLSDDAIVFSREYQTWSLKTIHSPSGGFTQSGASLPFGTTNGQKVTFPFSSFVAKQVIEASGTLHAGNPFATGTSIATVSSDTEVDYFGNPTVKHEFGVTSGGVSGITYDDERTSTTSYGFNLSAWIVGLPTETRVTDESGNFVSMSRTYYDNQGFGQIGSRGLATSEEQFIGTSGTEFPDYSPHPGDPRVGANASLTSTTIYDSFGNPTTVRDPAFGSGGHERGYGYDSTFQTYVETETIKVGNGSADLVASASYDKGGGVITSSTDFNNNVSSYLYDSFFRLTGIVKPGDSTESPTQVFQYQPGDPVRSLDYGYDAMGNLSLSVSSAPLVVSRVAVKSREVAGGGTFDIVQITDGAGHKLGTIEEGASGGQFVYKDVKRYTSRGAERDSFLPFFGGSPDFRNPPPDGDRVTNFYDAAGRAINTINPPETIGGARKSTRTDYLPLKTALFDEEDNDPGSIHAGTPHLQYQDGLGRLVGVDELNKEGAAPVTYPTRYTYDLADNLIKILDSQSNQKWMRYDGLKRMVFMHDPDRGLMTYTYDAASNLTRTLDAKNQVIEMTYDGANRIKTEDYLDAAGRTPDVTYTYDTANTVPAGDGTNATSAQIKGKLSSVTDLSGAEILSYDTRGRTAWKIKRIPDPRTGVLASYKSGFTYDSLDRLSDLTYPDGDNVGYGYNNRNLPQNITGGPGGNIISGMAYKASGQLDTTTYGNGVGTNYTYDPRLRLRSLLTSHSALGTQLISFAYQFDAASNITRIDDNRAAIPGSDPRKNTQVFGYDDLYRLTSVQYPALLSGSAGSISYAYDRIGNMLGQTSNITATENGLPLTNLGTMSYGGTMGPSGRIGRNGNQPGPHALTAVSGGSRSYPYDANGNMETIDGMACTWDFKDRLVAVENATMRADYAYDYTDRRITKKVTPKTNSTLNPQLSTSVSYIDRTYEVREDGSPVKYVWNGETRVARVTTNLNATQRLQRFTLHPGWNFCTLAVALTNAGTQLIIAPVQNVYRYNPATQTYHNIAANESLPAGTLLRVRASATGELAVRGTPAAATAVNYPAGRNWIGNATFQPLVLATALPADAPLWFWQSSTRAWRYRLPNSLGTASDTPARLEPGEAIFAHHTAAFTLAPADPTLEVRYYHQDHLGSSSVMTDATGQLVSESTFYPFGHPRNEHEPRNVKEAYGFTQKERDGESGLNYLEARYLISSTGRFNSVDPFTLDISPSALGDPQLYHAYAHGKNNPMAHNDPDGRLPNFVVGALIGAAVEVAQQVITAKIQGREVDLDVPSIVAAAAIGAATSGVTGIKAMASLGKVIANSRPAMQVAAAMAKGAASEVAEELVARGISSTTGWAHQDQNLVRKAITGGISEPLSKFGGNKFEKMGREAFGTKAMISRADPIGASLISKKGATSLYDSSLGPLFNKAASSSTEAGFQGSADAVPLNSAPSTPAKEAPQNNSTAPGIRWDRNSYAPPSDTSSG